MDGETQIKSINNFFLNKINAKITFNIISNLKISNYQGIKTGGKFSTKKLMFTGGFENMSRSEAKLIVEKNGGKVIASLSKKLDFLIVGNSKPTKSKIEKAKQLNVKILSEKEWNKILNS